MYLLLHFVWKVNILSFFIETTDIDLGDTPIENIFITDYMPIADGTYVKVYLLGFKYANTKDSNLMVNNDTLAKHLSIPLSDILRAWDYWEDKGIVKKHFNNEDEYNYKVEFINLKQYYINNILKPSNKVEPSPFINPTSSTTEELVQAKNTPIINEMFNSIRTTMKRYITPNEYKRIYDWIDTYNMSPDIIVKAFDYSSEKKNKRTLSFIEGIIRNWHDEGVTNTESLEIYFENKDIRFYRYNRVMKALGLNDLPSDAQKRYINKWFEEWNFDLEIILCACDETVKIRKPTFPYVDGILNKWYSDGVKTVEDIAARNENFKNNNESNKPKSGNNKNKPTRTNMIKTNFHNFEQTTTKYSDEELENKLMKNFDKKY